MSRRCVVAATLSDALETARALGVTVVRSHSVGYSTGGRYAFEPKLGVFNHSALDSADWAIAEAERLGMREGNAMHFAASISAGLAATAACSPLDFAKSRMMNDVGGQLRGSALRALTQAVRHEGLLAPYSGFFANWARIGPHTMVTFLSYEWLRKLASWEPLGA